MDDRKDIVVIGGGMAGLVAGAYAARTGARTLVLDAHALGGRARTHEHGRFRFNQGPHALYEHGEAMAALHDLGVPVPGGAPSTRIGVIVDGAQERFPVGAGTMARSGALSARGKVAAARLLGLLPRMRPGRVVGLTVDEWIAQRRLPDDAAGLLRTLINVATYANAPGELDAGATLQQLQRAVKGVRYLDGGWQAMVDGVALVAGGAGATVHDHVRVDRAERRGPAGWTIVTSEGDVHAGAVILAAGGPAAAARMLGVDADHFGEPGPPARATCLDLGLRDVPPTEVLFSVDEPLYLSTHMPPAQLGPAGAVVVHVARYLAPGEQPTAEEGQRQLWAHASAAGIEHGSATVLDHRYLHDMTVTHGIPLARLGGLAGRPAVPVEGLPGAFLAGDWVGDAGMLLDAAVASARAAATLAARHVALVPA